MGEEPPSCTEGGRLRAERCLHLDSVEWQACVDACISTHEGAGEPYPPSRRSSMGSMGRTHPVQTDPPVQGHPRSTEEEPPINGPFHQPFPFDGGVDGVFEIASSLQARADPPLAPREAAAPIACEGKPASRTGPGVRPTGEARPNGRRTVRFVRGRTCTSVGPMMEKPYELEHELQSRRVCWCDVEVPPLPNPLLASTRHRHLPLRRRQATRGHESRCYES